MSKNREREEATKLRQQGLSYLEISEKILVSKSTLSVWLRSIELSAEQKERLIEKQQIGIKRGGEKRKEQRIEKTEKIFKAAELDIDKLTARDLWLIGTALYWGEGHKEKDTNVSVGVIFTNSDALMIKLFLRWLLEICKVKREDLIFNIFIHRSHGNRLDEVLKYWAGITEFEENIFKIYFRNNRIKTERKNTGKKYYGILRVKVRRSSGLNRKITGWIRGINKYYWGVV